MTLSAELTARGYIHQHTGDSIATILDGEPRTVYLGIDPTADSIHVGNLVPYMLLNRLQQAGHKVILLLGGGTALIGDPGGKNEERPFVSADVIATQCAAMEAGVRRFVSGDVQFVNNYEWLSQVSMLDYLRDVGKHFTVNAMIKKDIVARRLEAEQPISYTEFSYSLLQGFDYHHLYKTYGCTVQIGGSDQWSNIIAGVEYIRRTEDVEVHAITNPIVTDKTTGKKFGKSEGNAVWLNAEKTSPYQFYQFWLNTADENVIDYLKIFTFLSLDEITTLEQQAHANPGAREAQRQLAGLVTGFVHGTAVTAQVQQVSEILFGGGDIATLNEAGIATLLENAPTTEVTAGTALVDVLVMSGLATSKREARTFIESGAIALDGRIITDVEAVVTTSSPISLLKRGKKQYTVLCFK